MGPKRKIESLTSDLVENYCESTPQSIPLNNSNYMQMNILLPQQKLASKTPSLLLPLLTDMPPTRQSLIDGLKADITLSKIRLDTIRVVYRGLCDLSKISNIGVTQSEHTFSLTLPNAPKGTRDIVNFTDFFTNPSKFSRDDLSSTEMRRIDLDILISISFLEKLLDTRITTDPDKIDKINAVINSFILCSSGKEYLDVGQLYAIVGANNIINNNNNDPTQWWSNAKITERAFNILEGSNNSYDLTINYPKKPFFETYDGAAARIAGKYFNVYTESTIHLSSDPRISRGVTQSPGSIPYLFENKYVLYLCFLYNNLIPNLSPSITAHFQGQPILNILVNVNQLLTNPQINPQTKIYYLFDLFYYLISLDKTNGNSLIQTYYEAYIGADQLKRIIDSPNYDLLSSIYYLFISNTRDNYKQNLIDANLDPLCHDNKGSDIYRLLMIYNLIKKNGSTTILQNEINQTFKTNIDTEPPITQLLASIPNDYLKNLNISDSKTFVNNYVLNLISRFNPIQQKMFYKLANYNYEEMEEHLFNRMLDDCCYVFQVEQKSRTLNLFGPAPQKTLGVCLITFQESISLSPVIEKTPIPTPIAPYSFSAGIFTSSLMDVKIISTAYEPYFTRAVCDLSLHTNISLTIQDLSKSGTSVFNVTPVTFNDAASATTLASVEYIDQPVTIPFGDPNVQQYQFVFHGINSNQFNDYKRNLKNLKYFYNLQAFDQQYNNARIILTSCGLEQFYYELLSIYGINFNKKDELLKISKCFLSNYDFTLIKYIRNNPEYNNLYENTLDFSQAFKKSLQIIQNKLQNFVDKDGRLTIVSIIEDPPIFRNFVNDIMIWIETLSDLPNKCALIDHMRNFTTEVTKHFFMEPIPDCNYGFNIGSNITKTTGRPTRIPKTGGSNTISIQQQSNSYPITLGNLFGQYGFYQKIDDNGAFNLYPITTKQQLQKVWNTYGLNVIDRDISEPILAKGIDAKLSDDVAKIRKEAIMRQLMTKKGFSLEQAKAEVDRTYQLVEGKDKYVPPATNISQLRQKYPELAKNTRDMVISTIGTQKSKPVGGKNSRKKRRHFKRKRTLRKQNKPLRKTRRK
jgi:hypothetical protein